MHDPEAADYFDAADVTRPTSNSPGEFAFHTGLTVNGDLDVTGTVSIHGVPTDSNHAVPLGYLRHDTISTLSQAPDVSITSPSDGDVLVYSQAASKWVNGAPRTSVITDSFYYTGDITGGGQPVLMGMSTGGISCPPMPFGLEVNTISLSAYDVPNAGDGAIHAFTVSLLSGSLTTTVRVNTVQAAGSVNEKKIAFGSTAVSVVIPEGSPLFVKIGSPSSYTNVGVAVSLGGYTHVS
eukprot:jgi/Mesvir1/26568/Mv16223-RA.1